MNIIIKIKGYHSRLKGVKMKNNKSKIISLILIIVLIAALIGFLIYETAQNGWQLKTDDLGKFVVVLAGLVLSLIRLLAAPRGTSLKIYERSYKEHICSAFSRPEQKKEKTKLFLFCLAGSRGKLELRAGNLEGQMESSSGEL